MAAVGVATPMKSELWRSSTLNLASRSALITARNTGMTSVQLSTPFSCMVPMSMTDGRTPKLTMSARESSSLPMGE